MILKKGITGLRSFKDPVLESTAINSILEKINYPYIYYDLVEPQINTNYFSLVIHNKNHDTKFKLLVNGVYYIVAGVTIESECMCLDFITMPKDFTDQCNDGQTMVLNKEILETIVPKKEIAVLGRAEIEQINYWGSRKYGEIIFNGYD